jgi:hypothetical protein
VTYDSHWQGEETNYRVEELGSIESVTEFLRREYDPLEFMGVSPKGSRSEAETYAVNRLLRNYNSAVSEILSEFPEDID